jgi:hypothetical protein
MSDTEIKFHRISSANEMSFSNEDGVVAKLKWDKGVLTHEGNIDESAELFLDLLNVKGLTQYNEMNHTINLLEQKLTIAKSQNDIYKKALSNN